MTAKIIKMGPPPEVDSLVKSIEVLLKRAKKGEFETIYIMAFTSKGEWITVERGKKIDRLRTIGVLESLKVDILQSTETDYPTNL